MAKIYSSGTANGISDFNTTIVPLGSNATFVGTSEEVEVFRSLSVSVSTDVRSAENGLVIEFSTDNVTWGKYQNLYTVEANKNRFICVQMGGPFARVSYTNGPDAQSTFELQTNFYENRTTQDLVFPSIENNFENNVNMYQLYGANKAIVPVANAEGMPMVEIGKPSDSFGDVPVSTRTLKTTSSFFYNIPADIYDVNAVGSGTAVSQDGMALLSTGTTTGSSVLIDTKDLIRYTPGREVFIYVTPIFGDTFPDTEQWVGIGTDDSGFYIGFTGDDFAILHKNNAVNTYILQSSFNFDVLDGKGPSRILLDPKKGNIFLIKVQSLFANIEFYIENPSTNKMYLFNTISYLNLNILPSLQDPAFRSRLIVNNGPTTNDVILQCSSATIYYSGPELINVGILNTINIFKTVTQNQYDHVLSIRNKSTFLSKTNCIPVLLTELSLSTESTTPTLIQIRKSATLSSASWVDIDTNNSVIEYTVNDEVISNGKILNGYFVNVIGTTHSLKTLDIQVNPGESINIVSYSYGVLSTIYASLTWRELF